MPHVLNNLASDPWDNDTYPEYYDVKSTYYGGTYENIILPNTPNFPVITPGRYVANLPVIPFVDDTIGYPIAIRDVTNSINLIYTSGSPGVNQYRYSPKDSITPDRLEFNASQSGCEIGFSYSGLGSIISENNWNNEAITGAIIMYGAATAPTGWLVCDGSAISRTQYITLFNILGTTWGVGDGSTTFNIPDLRAASPSGVGTSVGYTQNETIVLGTKYDDRLQGHEHNLRYYVGGSGVPLATVTNGTENASYNLTTKTIVTDSTNGTPRTGNTTRGKIVGVNYIIKY